MEGEGGRDTHGRTEGWSHRPPPGSICQIFIILENQPKWGYFYYFENQPNGDIFIIFENQSNGEIFNILENVPNDGNTGWGR